MKALDLHGVPLITSEHVPEATLWLVPAGMEVKVREGHEEEDFRAEIERLVRSGQILVVRGVKCT